MSRAAAMWSRLVWLLALALAIVLGATPAQAQVTEICLGRVITPMNFSADPTLVSGTALSAGAVYRYSNVTTGIDALVRIVALNGATLVTIDNNSAPAAGTPDLRPFFDPELGGVDARSIDFQFSYLVAGTNTALSFDFVATGIDIDGDGASIREYAELQNTYSEYLLNNPTNISVNASAPAAGNTRFEAITSATAPGIDPSANQNIAAAFYARSTGFNYRIGTLGTGATMRLTSLQFTCPNLPAPVSTTTKIQDFGDAPASYGNVRHDAVTGIRLGATNTVETAGYNSATATGDTGDDGVTIATLRQGQAATVTVAVVGAGGYLQAFFDWNRDGDFLDPGEQVVTNLADNAAGDTNAAAGTIVASFTVPSTAVMGQTFARFRWATQTGLDPYAIVGRDGEVEDYAPSVLGSAVLSTTKTSVVYSANTLQFFLPGNDIIYSVQTTNSGTAAADAGSIFVTDILPAEVELFVGDFDAAGPATMSVLFTQSAGAGLTFAAADLKYSSAVTAPTSFAACTYAPPASNVYDPAIRYICVNPKGAMASGTPPPTFTLQYKTRIK